MTPERMFADERREADRAMFVLVGQNTASIEILLNGHDKIVRDIADIRENLALIRAMLAEQKGEKRGAMWVASGVSAILAALIATFGKVLIGR